MNTPEPRLEVNNEISWYDFVLWNGVQVLRSDFASSIVNFCVSHIPGLEWLSPAKRAQLSARGIIASHDAESIMIPDSMREFIDWIHQSYGKDVFDISKVRYYDPQLSPQKLWKDGRGYAMSLEYYGVQDVIENTALRQRIRTFEFFNNKSRTLRWLSEHNLGEMVQDGTEYLNGYEVLKARLWQISFEKGEVYFIKSSVWASGAGTWKIASKGDTTHMLWEIWEHNYGKIRERIGEDGELLEWLYYNTHTQSWEWSRSVENIFVLQKCYQAVQDDAGEVQLWEFSANFFLSDSGGYLVTETRNLVNSKGQHEGNEKVQLPEWAREKLDSIIETIHRENFRWNIWFDFFLDLVAQKLIILECNPRNTGATNPEIVADIVERTQWRYGEIIGKYTDMRTEDAVVLTPHLDIAWQKSAWPQVVSF